MIGVAEKVEAAAAAPKATRKTRTTPTAAGTVSTFAPSIRTAAGSPVATAPVAATIPCPGTGFVCNGGAYVGPLADGTKRSNPTHFACGGNGTFATFGADGKVRQFVVTLRESIWAKGIATDTGNLLSDWEAWAKGQGSFTYRISAGKRPKR